MTGDPAGVKPRRGRQRDLQKRSVILDTAWAMFLAQGVEATSIEAIAGAAGVSKVTLYSHYGDKAALFEAAVLREMERIEAAQQMADPRGPLPPLRKRLRQFGIGITAFLASDPAVDFYAAIAGELRRHPDLARAFYALGPGRTRANLAALLAEAQARGELPPLDPLLAADELFGLWQGFTNFQFALGIDVAVIRADAPHRVERGIALFLRAYDVRTA